MSLPEKDLFEVTESIWQNILGLTIERAHQATDAAAASFDLTGCVQITGVWKGVVVVKCSSQMARQAASILFRLDSEHIGPQHMQDALAELANMAGGNLKSLLPGPNELSLPAVVEGAEHELIVTGSRLTAQIDLSCGGLPVQVALFEANDDAPLKTASEDGEA